MDNATLKNARERFTGRRGAMLPFVAVSMVGLLGMAALATDLGAGNRQRRIAQTAADAAAIGGGRQIERHFRDASVIAFAQHAAAQNGFPVSEVTVHYPPATGNHVGDSNYVEVLIVKSIPTIFGRIFNKNTLDIQARAVAGLASASSFCVYSLASSGTGIDWSGRITTDCGIAANSSIDLKKGIDGSPPPDISAVGTIDTKTARPGHNFPGIPPVADPFSYLTVPPEGTCLFTNLHVTANQTLFPGEYCGGIKINDNVLVTLTPSTQPYIMRGGGLTGGQVEAWGGVTIINANGPGNDQSAFKPITFGNNCRFHIQAPASGPYKGVAVLQDPAGPVAATAADYVNDFCGKGVNTPCDPADVDIEGLVYLPTQSYYVGNSNGKLTIAGTLITKFMTSHSGAETCMYRDTSGNSAPKRLSLVE